MKKSFFIICLVYIWSFSSFPISLADEYYSPNMLIPKKVYQDDTYDVPRLNRVKSNELFGWEIFSRTPHFPLATVVYYPGGMTSHKYLMVTDITWNRVIISDEWNDWVTRYGDRGDGDEQFLGPHGISSLGAEAFFIADTYNDRVAYGDVSGDPPVIWWRGTYTGLNFPLDVDARSKTIHNQWPLVVVADAENHRVMLYEHPNMRACSYTQDRDNNVQFVYPTSLCFGRDNGAQNLQLYVADEGLHKLLSFGLLFSDSTTECPELTSGYSYEFPKETFLSAIDVDNKGQVYVVETRDGKIYKFSKQLDLIAVWGGEGVEDGQLLSPTGISIAHGMDCTNYPDPCTPISDLADVFITEYWTDQTGVRRFILGVDVLDFSTSYTVPVVDTSNKLIGGNYIEFSYYNTDYADIAVMITGPGVAESFHWWDLQPGEHSGTWDVEDNPNGTYTVSITANSIYESSNCDEKSQVVEVDKSDVTHAPIITEGPYFYPQPPEVCQGESYKVKVDAFDPDDEGIDYYHWNTGYSSFSNGKDTITTEDNWVWLNIVEYPGGGRVAQAVNYKPSAAWPDFIQVEVVDVDNASSVRGMAFTPEDCGSDPPPGCPYLYVWNGERHACDNVVLTGSEDEEINKSSLIDYYILSESLKLKEGEYELVISEFENEVSRIDKVSLFAVDYPLDENIGITSEGKVWIYSDPVSPISCVDQNGVDHLSEVIAKDDTRFTTHKPGYLIVNYGKLNSGGLHKPSDQMSSGGGTGIDPPDKTPNKLAPPLTDSKPNIVSVSVINESGEWINVGKVYPRTRSVLRLVELSQYVNPDEDFKIKISWEYSYTVDHTAYYRFDDSQIKITELELSSANHSESGDINSLVNNNDDKRITLSPGESIGLQFSAVPADSSKERKFLFVVKGYYEAIETPSLDDSSASPKVSSPTFEQNYPNPFNASTSINFTLPYAGKVNINIYNILGQKVVTLLDEEKSAGAHTIIWDGRDKSGAEVASGIYFYRIKAGDYKELKKMLLIK